MKKSISFIAALLYVFTGSLAFSRDSVQMTVDPKVLNIDAFYNGAALTVTGTTSAAGHIVVRFVGADCDLHMKERGKVFGIVWMNLDSLIFRGVPSVCLVSSAVDFKSLAENGNPESYSAIKALRLSGIEETARIESNGLENKAAFREFLKLKQSEGLYGEVIGNISYGPASDGQKNFKAIIPVPSRLLPGSYVVELAAISNGKIVAEAREPVTVNLVGFPARLSSLAFGHAALYGVLATVIAILAGLAIGIVFQSKGAH